MSEIIFSYAISGPCQLYLLDFVLFSNNFCTKEKCFSEMQSFFSKACINSPVQFMHFSSDTFYSAIFVNAQCKWQFYPYFFFRHLMHFQILSFLAHKLRCFHGRCESLKILPHVAIGVAIAENSFQRYAMPCIHQSCFLC